MLFRWGVSTLERQVWSCDDPVGLALLVAALGETPGYPDVSDLQVARYAARLLDGEILVPGELVER